NRIQQSTTTTWQYGHALDGAKPVAIIRLRQMQLSGEPAFVLKWHSAYLHLLQLYTRINPFIDDIRDQVEQHGRDCHIYGNGINNPKIRALYRNNHFTSNARNAKEAFNQKSTDQQGRQARHDIRNNGN